MPHSPEYRAYLLSEPWRLKRAAVLRRCFSICERCGRHKATEVHHLTYERLGEERMEDLMALCKACHQYLEREKSQKRNWREP